MSSAATVPPIRVVVVGGGVAALEAVLALRALAADAVDLTLVAPEPVFELRALQTAAPFARGSADGIALRELLGELDGTFVRAAVVAVDADRRRVRCADGLEIPYDTLVLALGATAVPAFCAATTLGAGRRPLGELVADLHSGRARSAAFVVPRGATWPLPLYELALMTAEALTVRRPGTQLHLVTPELQPLSVFGPQGSVVVAELLRDAGITVHRGVAAEVRAGGIVDTGFDPVLRVDRVLALPALEGPRLDGVPATAQGFVPVSDHGVVDGLDGVYAVGDMTDRPVKQGGLACQQAEAAAAHIAWELGRLDVLPPLRQVLRGRLLTGRRDRFLERQGPRDVGSVGAEPLWWPPSKVAGRHLAPYLEGRGLVRLPLQAGPGAPGLDLEIPVLAPAPT